VNYNEIDHGWDVIDANGEKVGDVREVRTHYLITEKGFLFASERYIPRSAITRIEHDRVHLNVAKDQIDAQGWDREPEAAAMASEQPERPTEPTWRGEGQRLELREEELRPRKQEVETGEARVRKEVVTEERTMEVPRTREEVYVERRPTERQPADRPIGEGETVRVPVREEQVRVEKETVVAEELEVGKRSVHETEQVSGTVRREEARVEREGDVDIREERRPR
jgi:uncharacterized protein (TIGR02271 family)